MNRLLELYKKTGGGHCILSDADYKEYTTLRKEEFCNKRDELIERGCQNILPVKGSDGDIIGWTWEDVPAEGEGVI